MSSNLGSLVTQYTTILDEVIEAEAKTADLTANQNLVGEFVGAGIIKVAKIVMDGLGDYSRASGFVEGDIDLSWETMQLTHDRGRSFSIDIMDDEERLRIVTMNLMTQFVRTKVVPEVDATRFATLAANAGNVVSAAISTSADATNAVLAAEEIIEDTGVPLSECFLYCTSAFKGLLRKAQEYRLMPGDTPNTLFEQFDDMRLIPVPQNRFYTAIDLYDGTTSSPTDETGGGYVKHVSTGGSDPAGKALNFMIVHPEACAAITKHETLRYFAPEVNQAKDAHLWQYRVYHDMLVYENKAGLIYAHAALS